MALFAGNQSHGTVTAAVGPQRPEEENNTTNHSLTNYDRNVEYISAQRAAVEAIQIGQQTLEATVRQGEQLKNAEYMAEETEYKLDRANRILRGMTWSGWWANKFSRDVEPPEYKNANNNATTGTSLLGPPKVYEDVPGLCSIAAQSVQNYHANLQVLEDCETEEQRETGKLICNNMHQQAVREVLSLRSNENVTVDPKSLDFVTRLEQDLRSLRNRQLVLQQVQRGLTTSSTNVTTNVIDENRSKLLDGAKQQQQQQQRDKKSNVDDSMDVSSPIDLIKLQQEEHLDSMAKHVNELSALAGNLSLSLAEHTDTLDSLDEKNDTMHFKTKMVTRRADQLIQKKSWIKEKAEFVQYASIQHQPSGKYLSVAPNNDSTLVLSTIRNERCIFGIWKRKHVLGFQNQYNKKWAGQSLLLGQLTCTSTTFGRREEWDVDNENDWSDTTLLIASAGWGTGAYLLLDKDGKGNLPTIGSDGLEDKKIAPKWSIQPFDKS